MSATVTQLPVNVAMHGIGVELERNEGGEIRVLVRVIGHSGIRPIIDETMHGEETYLYAERQPPVPPAKEWT